jgi:3-isopropylmalate dehydrogenase
MMLRESFGLAYQAEVIAEAVRSVWREGWRTADMHTPGTRIVGTQEMSVRIADRAALLVREAWHPVRAKRLAA